MTPSMKASISNEFKASDDAAVAVVKQFGSKRIRGVVRFKHECQSCFMELKKKESGGVQRGQRYSEDTYRWYE